MQFVIYLSRTQHKKSEKNPSQCFFTQMVSDCNVADNAANAVDHCIAKYWYGCYHFHSIITTLEKRMHTCPIIKDDFVPQIFPLNRWFLDDHWPLTTCGKEWKQFEIQWGPTTDRASSGGEIAPCLVGGGDRQRCIKRPDKVTKSSVRRRPCTVSDCSSTWEEKTQSDNFGKVWNFAKGQNCEHLIVRWVLELVWEKMGLYMKSPASFNRWPYK